MKKLFKKIDHVNISLYEVEVAQAEFRHTDPTIIGFFNLQYAKLRTLEMYYNFFTKFCDLNLSNELVLDADSLSLALTEKEPEDFISEKQ